MSVVSSLAAASSSMSTTSSSMSSTSSVGVSEGQGSGSSHVRNLLFSPPDSEKVGTINFTLNIFMTK
jgi:hypothetical protein